MWITIAIIMHVIIMVNIFVKFYNYGEKLVSNEEITVTITDEQGMMPLQKLV
jgi:hypothetical protein